MACRRPFVAFWIARCCSVVALHPSANRPLLMTLTASSPLLDVPVYSLATLAEDGRTNMNVVTYASPVGIRPSRAWAVSLYRGTESHENFFRRKSGVLQLLRSEHSGLMWTLGGLSGRDIDKKAACAQFGLPWSVNASFAREELLPHCASYLAIEEMERFECGDHDVAICRVAESLATGGPHLTTGELRASELITTAGRAVEPPYPTAP